MKLEPEEWVDRGNYRVSKLYSLSESCYIQLVEVKPKEKVGKHYHLKQTEVFAILNGRAKFGIGDEVFDAKTGDVFVCKPGDRHWVENGDEPFRILVFKYNWEENDIYWE